VRVNAATKELRYEFRGEFAWGAPLWLVLGLLFLLIGVAGREPVWGLGVFFCVCAAVLQFRARHRAMRVFLRPDALYLEPQNIVIPLDSIESLTLAGMPRAPQMAVGSKPIMIMHRGGVTELPAGLVPDSSQLYRAILQRLSPSGRRETKAILANECRVQEGTFGVERVWTYFPRTQLGERPAQRGFRATAIAMVITGLVMLALGLVLPKSRHWEPATAAGGIIFALAVGAIFLAINHQNEKYPRQTIRNWQRAGLLISPAGLWLTQDDLSGFLRWNEVVDVRVDPKVAWWKPMVRRQMPGILELAIAGGKIEVWDIYDRPLPVIADVIRSLWRPPAATMTTSNQQEPVR